MYAPALYNHIESTPDVLGGKPRIAGRRIAVQDIVVWHERMGRSADEIASDYSLRFPVSMLPFCILLRP